VDFSKFGHFTKLQQWNALSTKIGEEVSTLFRAFLAADYLEFAKAQRAGKSQKTARPTKSARVRVVSRARHSVLASHWGTDP